MPSIPETQDQSQDIDQGRNQQSQHIQDVIEDDTSSQTFSQGLTPSPRPKVHRMSFGATQTPLLNLAAGQDEEEDEDEEILTPFAGPAKKKKMVPAIDPDLEPVENLANVSREQNQATLARLLSSNIKIGSIWLDISRITKCGTLRDVTDAGKAIILASFETLGLIPTERLTIVELPPDEKELGIHCLQTRRGAYYII